MRVKVEGEWAWSFPVWGSGFRGLQLHGLGYGVQGFGLGGFGAFGFMGFRCEISGFRSSAKCLKFRAQAFHGVPALGWA